VRNSSFILFGLTGALGLIFDEPSYQFFLFHFCVLFFTIWVGLFLYGKNILSNVTLIVLSVHCFGVASLISYMADSSNDIIYNNVHLLHLYDYVGSIAISYFIPPLVVLIISFLITRRQPTSFDFLKSVYQPDIKIVYFILIVSLVVILRNFFYLFGRIPVIVYVITIMHAAFSLYTFWVGYWNRRLGWVFPFALLSISMDSIVSILEGGRYIFFLHATMYYLGFVLSKPVAGRKWLIAWAIVLLPFLVTLIGVMGVVRDSLGRGEAVLQEEGRTQRYIEAFRSVTSGESGLSNEQIDELAKGRNVNWPNLSSIALTPAVIPYIGFANISNEIDAIFKVEGLTGGTEFGDISNARLAQIDKGLATGMANLYGYFVNEGNSVEWGLLADAWSKGGPWMYVFLFSVLFVIFLLIEKAISRTSYFQKIVYTLVLIRIVFMVSNSQPFYETIRMLILNFILAFSIVWTFKQFVRKI